MHQVDQGDREDEFEVIGDIPRIPPSPKARWREIGAWFFMAFWIFLVYMFVTMR